MKKPGNADQKHERACCLRMRACMKSMEDDDDDMNEHYEAMQTLSQALPAVRSI